jgi:uncharacterized protein with beta-barrel porin domain
MALGGIGSIGGDGGNVTVINGAVIETYGRNANGIFAQSVGGGGGNGGATNLSSSGGSLTSNLVLGSDGGSGGVGGDVSVVILNDVKTAGANSNAILAQSIGGGGGNGSIVNLDGISRGTSSFNMTLGNLVAAGGAGQNSGAVDVDIRSGLVYTTGDNAMGVFAQSVGGGGGSGGVVNYGLLRDSGSVINKLGGNGGTSGNGDTVTVVNRSTVVTAGDNSVAILAQSVGGGGGVSGVKNRANEGTPLVTQFSLGAGNTTANGSSGANGNGAEVNVTNTGAIRTSGSNAIGVFAQSIGGGGGLSLTTISNNLMSIADSRVGAQSGTGGSGGDVNVLQTGSIITSGAGSVGIVAQSVGGGGGYLGMVSKDANASILNGTNVTMGGVTSAVGHGGNVVVTNNSEIRTSGANSVGILAQSVGGGGGVIMMSGAGTISPTWAAGKGNGGSVTVNVNSPIYTTGAGAYGVVAESVGGGGGLAISGTTVTDSGGVGSGLGGLVTINVLAPIYASGAGAIAVYGHSLGGIADPIVTVAPSQTVTATSGASAVVLDGSINSLTNYGRVLGSVTKQDILTETALETRGNGFTTLFNYGTMTGNINAASGTITATNYATGILLAGADLNLGSASSTLTNYGIFASAASSGARTISETNINGSFIQDRAGITFVRVDSPINGMDKFIVSGDATLDGLLKPVPVDRSLIAPGSFTSTIFQTAGTLNSENARILDDSIIMSYGLGATSSGIALTATANFTPPGMSSYGTQIGSSIGSMQTAGSSDFFGTVTARLVTTQSTVAQLDQTYNALAGSAISALPQVNYQAVNRSISTFSDRMNSWRVGDSFIASTKNARALLTNVPSANAPVIPGSDNEDLPESSKKSGEFKTWITPFGGEYSTNSLNSTIYGGSLGLEVDSVDRSLIGGVGLTVSQTNFSYSSSNTPYTPGNATNYGLSFYLGARGEHAYVSGIGYFGGSSAVFNRQLQTLGFSTSTNVNIHSTVASARIEAGYNLLPNKNGSNPVQLTPFVAFQPTQVRQNGANEYFTGYGAGFYYGANRNNALPLSVGAELSGDIDLGNNHKLMPFLRVSWVTDLASQQSMGAAYVPGYGPTIYANGTPSFGDALIFKGGMRYNWTRNISAYATIDVEQGNATYNYRGIGGSIGMRYSW